MSDSRKELDLSSLRSLVQPVAKSFQESKKIPLSKLIADYLVMEDKTKAKQLAFFITLGFLNREPNKKEMGYETIYKLEKALKKSPAFIQRYYYVLGMAYFYGHGTSQNYATAFDFFNKSAQLEDDFALNFLGLMYNQGYCGEKDPAQAIQYYKKAAELENMFALYNLAYCFKDGYGVEKDEKQSLAYHERAAQQGVPGALNALGIAYEKEQLSLKRDIAKAKALYKLSSEFDYSIGLYNLGLTYSQEKNKAKAKSLFEQAASFNHSNALFELGIISFNHDDFDEAAYYYRMSLIFKNDNQGAKENLNETIKHKIHVEGNYHAAMALGDLERLQKAYALDRKKVQALWEADIVPSSHPLRQEQAHNLMKAFILQDKTRDEIRARLAVREMENAKVEESYRLLQDNLNPENLSDEENFNLGQNIYAQEGEQEAYSYLRQAAMHGHADALRLLENISNHRLDLALNTDTSFKPDFQKQDTFTKYQFAKTQLLLFKKTNTQPSTDNSIQPVSSKINSL